MDDIVPLGPHGRPSGAKRGAKGRYAQEPVKADRISYGDGRLYILRRLSRDGHHILIALMRNREISGQAAAARAGFGKARARQVAPNAKVNVRCLIG
jgi:hypothetical protein